jgi:hypothetical protein
LGRQHGPLSEPLVGPGQQRVDQPAPGLVGRAGHGGQRRVAEVGLEDVVEADHADRARHVDPAMLHAAQHADGDQVV